MKSDVSIKNISLAAIKRHSVGLETWQRTTINPNIFPSSINLDHGEIPLVLFNCSQDNWTLITTRSIVGQINGERHRVHFAELDDVVFGDYKRIKSDTTIFRTTDFYGKKGDFLMEPGPPAMAFVYAINAINNFYKTSA
jgi:hypothetical protein